MDQQQLLDARLWFTRQYRNEPQGAWFAPGRANLIGGPDYADVLVMPFALQAGVSAVASRRSDGQIRLASRQFAGNPITLPLDALEPGSVGGWAAYPAGVAWALCEAGYVVGGADIAIHADLPIGAGLSSSAALECSIALALTDLHEIHVPTPELAELARLAENQFVGIPTGIMDQLASLLCRAGHALLLDCQSRNGVAIPLSPSTAGLRLLIIDTCIRRRLTDGRYGSRRQACDDAAATLGVRSLRDVAGDQLAPDRLTDPILQRRCRHVISEYRRALDVADALRVGQFGRIGDLLTASHLSLRDDFEVSWPQADAAVEAAVEAGALGARMMGGGFGGCVIALVPVGRTERICGAIVKRFAESHWAAPRFIDAVPSEGARRIS
jgi:galactokinase